jgi:hypothetical protein
MHGNVRFEVFTAVTMKNGVFWDVALLKTDFSEELSASFVIPSISSQRASVASYG